MNNPHILAFYLPQYHPVKENDENFGEGFTEWTNVAKAKPLFRGHVQPKIPADLGFYDLRIPEVRKKQAELAKQAGISAFCYYHYWFGNGKVVLEKPLQEVVRLGEPDFPFCICWANHSWFKKDWNPDLRRIEENLLFEQTYPDEQDIKNHFYFLLSTFKDPRYYKIDGKLVFAIYNIKDRNVEYWTKFKSTWNELAKDNNLSQFYFIAYTSVIADLDTPLYNSFDKVILSLVTNIQYKQQYGIRSWIKGMIRNFISKKFNYPMLLFSYKEAMKYLLVDRCKDINIIPVVVPNWDYTARRGVGGLILKESTPELFRQHIRQAFDYIKNKPNEDQILFVKSWNEWGEGNYMEPDLQFGRQYIQVMGEEIKSFKSEQIKG